MTSPLALEYARALATLDGRIARALGEVDTVRSLLHALLVSRPGDPTLEDAMEAATVARRHLLLSQDSVRTERGHAGT